MPHIIFDEEIGADLNLETVEFSEDQSDSGQIGKVFKGIGRTKDAQTLPVAIKFPLSLSKIDLVHKEHEILRSLAENTRQAHPEQIVFTPIVQLGYQAETNLPALVMPFYQTRLMDEVREAIQERRLLDADIMAVEAGIMFTYVLEGLHQMEHTCTDRKVTDLFIYQNQLVVIDWNMLRPDSKDNRQIELGVAFGQIWHELFLGTKSIDYPAPLNDDRWQPIGGRVEGGIPGLGLRFILANVLHHDPSRRFDGNPSELRYALESLFKVLRDSTTLNRDSFGSYVPLTDKDVIAIQADIHWRQSGAEIGSSEHQARNDGIISAYNQYTAQDLSTAIMSVGEGDYRNAIASLEHYERDASDIEKERVKRWIRLIAALSDPNDRTARHLRDNRRKLLDIWSSIDQTQWAYDDSSRLRTHQSQLEDIVRGIPESGEAYKQLFAVLSEIRLRQLLVEYHLNRGNDHRRALLKTIKEVSEQLPDIYHHLNAQFSIEHEITQLNKHADVARLLTESVQRIRQALLEQDYRLAHVVYHEYHTQIVEKGTEVDQQQFNNEVIELVDLANFCRVVSISDMISLSLNIRQALKFQQSTILQKLEIADQALIWLKEDMTRAVEKIKFACKERNLTSVENIETIASYHALNDHTLLFAQRNEHENLYDLLKNYKSLHDFFQKFFGQVLKALSPNQARAVSLEMLPNSPEWWALLQEAKQKGADMSDIFSSDFLEKWQSLLLLDEVQQELEDFAKKITKKLDDSFWEPYDAVKAAVAGSQQLLNIKEELKNTQEIIFSTAINNQLQVAQAHLNRFEIDKAEAILLTTGKRLQALRSTMERIPSFEQMQAQFDTIVTERRELKSVHPEILETFRQASFLLDRYQLPEEENLTDFATQAANHRHLPAVAILQERYWAVRLERTEQNASANVLTSVVLQSEQSIKLLLKQIRQNFYEDNATQVRANIDILKSKASGDTLADVLIVELITNWEDRLHEYNRFITYIDSVARYLDQDATAFTVEELIEIMDILVEKMRGCPGEIFTNGINSSWVDVFKKAIHLYQQLRPDGIDPAKYEGIIKEADKRVILSSPVSNTLNRTRQQPTRTNLRGRGRN